MLYVVSAVLVVVALSAVGFVAFRVIRLLRGYRATASMVSARTSDRIGLLRARSAAVRVAVRERRRH
ncbi:bacteriophage holin [Saccharomonospora azurea]|uniref:bacteriophage holin n=1 Tax=Saccharomonospora azurea TaxID=40988 RepID=UPI00056D7061